MTRAVLLDALGTLVRLEPPAPRLREELARRGVEVGAADAERAFRAEISYYLEHHLEGRDAASLAALRDRCAAVLAAELPGAPAPERVREPMLAAISFSAYPDAAPALDELRERGLRLVVASNWDCSLPRVLEDAGLAGLVDGVAASAAVGAAKPAAALFRAALELAGAGVEEAVHVGDSEEKDLAGARAAGLRAVLLARDGSPPPGAPAISSLAELPSLI